MLRWLALGLLALAGCPDPDKTDPVVPTFETATPDPGCEPGVFGVSRFADACFQ